MYGAILGDIIGSRFEFDRPGHSKNFELFTEECCFTDDTVMTAAVAAALMSFDAGGGENSLRRELIGSMQQLGRKYPYAGYGARFIHWLFEFDPKPYNSWGNGSAMRVSPAGWLYGSLEKTREIAASTAEISHNHPEGIKGAECTAAVVYLARTGESKSTIAEYVKNEFGYDFSMTLDEMRLRHRHDESCMDSLPKALRSFFDGNSYEDVVRNAVSLGGDTDTIAAIAGAMGEAMFGIPEELLAKGKEYLSGDILDIAQSFEKCISEAF